MDETLRFSDYRDALPDNDSDDGFPFGATFDPDYLKRLARMDASYKHYVTSVCDDGIYVGQYNAGMFPTHEPIDWWRRLDNLAPHEEQARREVHLRGHCDWIDWDFGLYNDIPF